MTESDPIHSSTDFLRAEFIRRRQANPAYSLRAFARQLKISSGGASEIMAGKRQLSLQLAQKLAKCMQLTPEQTVRFLDLVSLEQGERRLRQSKQKTPGASQGHQARYQVIDSDLFYAISDWHHFAILSLMSTRSFRSDAAWIARRLGISTPEVNAALERLLRLGYISHQDGCYVLQTEALSTTTDIPSEALRRSHVQSMQQAIEYIDVVDVSERDVSSITIAVNKSKIPVAKELIRNFRRLLADFLESGEKDEVYNLNIQLMPVSGVKQ